MRHLFVIRRGPHEGGRPQETLDVLLTLAAFDQTVDAVLLDAGVWQLHRDQRAETLARKNIAVLWQALEIYGVDPPWVERESLVERGLSEADLVLPVRLLARERFSGLLQDYDRVVGG
ncbi:MAG: sulfurtransferase complex subunit TusC [Methylohalobius sp. ZOD2]